MIKEIIQEHTPELKKMSFQLRGPSIKNKRNTSLKTCRTLLTKRFEFQRKEKKTTHTKNQESELA